MEFKKQEGFAGQISVVIPGGIKKNIRENPLISRLYLTDIGYYPNARHHYRERANGADEDILIYVIDGKGNIRIEDNNFSIGANQFFIIPAKTAHWYKADEENPWTIYWVHFREKSGKLFEGMYARNYKISPSKMARIKERLQLFDEIIEILSLGFSPDNIEYANLCLYHLLASFRYIDEFRKINYAGEKDVVKKATLFMKQHIEKPLTLEQISKQFGISASHFSRLFRQRTRHSPMDYFIQLKIQHACQLLDYSDLRVHEIASAIGYDDAYYFSRIFKKSMGVSPSFYKFQDRKKEEG